ncbi:hypothetical protein CFP56_034071 [Quercus suber]|uniref:Uncharacterized protein n=1 Tax=Quercus suber TaxID=58331 RepID=A0AAW0JEN1_QUESU
MAFCLSIGSTLSGSISDSIINGLPRGGTIAISPSTRSGLITHKKASNKSGPMVYICGSMEDKASNTSCSKESNVFKMIAEALGVLSHMNPISNKLKKPHELGVQNWTSGIPNLSAASRVKDIQPSEIIQVTGGTFEDEVSLSLERRLQNGTRQFFEVESQSEATSWLTSASDGGRPSGMVSK